MSKTSQSFRQEAEKDYKSTSEFHFPGIDQELESANQNDQEQKIDSCYELMPKGEKAPKLKLIFKNGNRCTFPYAYLLRIEFNVDGFLYIYTSEKEIAIEGRGLDHLEDRLYDNQVKWIRESRLSFDIKQGQVFVKSVEVRERQKK